MWSKVEHYKKNIELLASLPKTSAFLEPPASSLLPPVLSSSLLTSECPELCTTKWVPTVPAVLTDSSPLQAPASAKTVNAAPPRKDTAPSALQTMSSVSRATPSMVH